MDDAWARFIVLFFGDPHALESGEGRKDRTTDPYGVFTLRWCNDLNLDGGRCEGGNFLLHTIGNTGVHGCATRQYSVGVKILTDINIALHDGVEDCLMGTAGLHTQERRLEHGLGGTETLITNGNNLTIRQF